MKVQDLEHDSGRGEYSRRDGDVNRRSGAGVRSCIESDGFVGDSRSECKKSQVRGGANGLLLFVLALLGLAAALAVMLLSQADETSAPLQPEQPTTTGVSTGRPSFTLAQQDAPIIRSLAEEQAILKPAVFDGKGTIAGHLFIAPGAKLPKHWTLILEPSKYLQGKELAVSQRLELRGDQLEFKIERLPQAGYVVRATAPGMNSTEVNVLLARGLEHQYVNIKLRPAGFLDGGVTNKNGEPLDGLDVVLESVKTHVRVVTQTDMAGNYIFRGVLDGEYLLYFGSPDSPLLPAQSVLFRAPSLRFPTREIPHDGELTLRVVDSTNRLLPDAKIRGWGSVGGVLDAVTDSHGEAHFRFLPPGSYKIIVTVDTRNGRGSVIVSEQGHAKIKIVVED